MPLRETRRFKTRGFAISFGDIMLPLVGVIAISLVIVAGKLFFSGPQANNPSIPIIMESPRPQEKPAQAQENDGGVSARKPDASEPTAPVSAARPAAPTATAAPVPPERRSEPALDVLAVPYGGSDSKPAERVAPAVTVATPARQTPAQRAQPKPKPAPRAQPKPPAPKPQPARADATSKESPKWMVQAGAFSTQEAARAFGAQISKAGYTPIVTSSATLHKVFVQAGATKNEALSLAKRMNGSGFQGAFIVPPRP